MLFLEHYESIWLNMYQGSTMHFYRRYVVYTLCFFNTEHDAISFFDYLNSQQSSKIFTREKDTSKGLYFLQICIYNKDPSCLLILVHRKGIFTGLLNNFFSFTSFSCKIDLSRTLLDRAYKRNIRLNNKR